MEAGFNPGLFLSEVIHEDAIKVGVRVTKRCRLVPPFILVS